MVECYGCFQIFTLRCLIPGDSSHKILLNGGESLGGLDDRLSEKEETELDFVCCRRRRSNRFFLFVSHADWRFLRGLNLQTFLDAAAAVLLVRLTSIERRMSYLEGRAMQCQP